MKITNEKQNWVNVRKIANNFCEEQMEAWQQRKAT